MQSGTFGVMGAEDPIQYEIITEAKPITAIWASGTTAIGGGEVIWRNATVNRIALGQFVVSFADDHPNGDTYEILFGQAEDGAARDVPKVSWVEGTRTASGFSVQITLDDNGGTADTYNDDQWSFAVLYDQIVVTGVSLKQVQP